MFYNVYSIHAYHTGNISTVVQIHQIHGLRLHKFGIDNSRMFVLRIWREGRFPMISIRGKNDYIAIMSFDMPKKQNCSKLLKNALNKNPYISTGLI